MVRGALLRVTLATLLYLSALAVLVDWVSDVGTRSPMEALRRSLEARRELASRVRSHPREARALIQELLRAGVVARAGGDAKSAMAKLESAERLGRVLQDAWDDGSALRSIEVAFRFDRGDAEAWLRALGRVERAERLARNRTDLERAERLAREAGSSFEALGDAAGRLRALHARATAGNLRSDHDAEAIYRELRRLARDDPYRSAAALNNLSAYQEAAGHYRVAVSGYRETLELARNHGFPRIEGFALLYTGNLYHRLGLPEEATSWFLRAERVFEEIGELGLQAMAASNRGASLQLMGRTREALGAYRRAIAVAARHGGDGRPATLLLSVAELLHREGRSVEAVDLLEELVSRSEGDGNEYLRWGALVTLAEVRLASGDGEAAAAALEKAEALLHRIKRRLVEVETKLTRARLLLHRGKDGFAERNLEEAVDTIERLRAQPELAEERIRFLEAQTDAYRMLASVKARREATVEELFELLERFRARALLDSLAGGTVLTEPQHGGAPARKLPGVSSVVPLSRVQKSLAPGALLLHLSLLDDALLVLEVPAFGEASVHRRPGVSRKTRALVEELTEAWSRPGRPRIRAARELSEVFLAPVAESISTHRTLVIVPDRALFVVPWGALPVKGGRLAELHNLVVAPSASSWSRLESNAERMDVVSALVVSSPVSAESRSLAEAAREGREITALFSRARLLEGELANERAVAGALSGHDILHFATHARVEPGQPLSSSLLLSGGPVDRGTAALATLDPDDGLLTGYEVLRSEIAPGALVTLAACDTVGRGARRGEGVVGIARAFFEAGASSVVASHWPVEDRATRELMVRFYRRLTRDRVSRVEALSSAQRALSRGEAGERFRDPYFWAGFVLLGAGQLMEGPVS